MKIDFLKSCCLPQKKHIAIRKSKEIKFIILHIFWFKVKWEWVRERFGSSMAAADVENMIYGQNSINEAL
jgi:hypothetical protein